MPITGLAGIAGFSSGATGVAEPLGIRGTGTLLEDQDGWGTLAHTLPSYQAGDYVLLQCFAPSGGGLAQFTTPSGWSVLANGYVGSNNRDPYVIFYRKMNGSEGSTVNITDSSGASTNGVNMMVQSIALKGVKSSGTFYESLFHYATFTNVAPKGLSLQAHGADRMALHFFFGSGTTTPQLSTAADDFTDAYLHQASAAATTSGIRAAIACSYKDITASELTTSESRGTGSTRWAVVSVVILGSAETAGSPLARRYWRIRGIAPAGSGTQIMSAAEIEMRLVAAGADQTSSANAIASSEFSSPTWLKGRAFDNNASQAWGSADSAYTTQYIGQDFASDKLIAEILYTARNDTADFNQSPAYGVVEASPDNTKWEGRAYFSGTSHNGLTWTLGSSNTITVPTA